MANYETAGAGEEQHVRNTKTHHVAECERCPSPAVFITDLGTHLCRHCYRDATCSEHGEVECPVCAPEVV